jgi:hypothetical protein
LFYQLTQELVVINHDVKQRLAEGTEQALNELRSSNIGMFPHVLDRLAKRKKLLQANHHAQPL